MAGITKYKARRKETLRKLESVSDNLVRLNDILGEVASQMKLCERRANRAQRYQKLSDETRKMDIRIQKTKK